MNITFNSSHRYFKIDTTNTSYVISVVGSEGFVGHAYFGKKISDEDVSYLTRIYEPPFTPDANERDRLSFYDCFPFEYPTHGAGDFREAALKIKNGNGNVANVLTYKEYEIVKGKNGIPGLPATWGNSEDSMALFLTLEDKESNIEVTLIYSVFEGIDAVTRSAVVKNTGKETVSLLSVASASFDFDNKNYERISLFGTWARERAIDRKEVPYGISFAGSKRGETSHQLHPFTCVLEKTATQTQGEVYGLDLIYSGNFRTLTERSQFDSLRMMTGINPDDFCWQLKSGESFYTPEAVLVYSSEGIGNMSRTFHDLYRQHLIRGCYKDKKRPVLINNWEATYFDFNEEKLINIAETASKLGIEMLVMDDGWFGNRYDDNRSLGDWYVNEEKLKGGLKFLADEVNKRGMKLGIWFEPEMISPDSDLYREHPDWAIHVEGRRPGLARNQLVLDFTNPVIVDEIYRRIKAVLNSANIEYVKWDMNRPLSDIGSLNLPKEQAGEFFHRYMLGVYSLQERLVTDFPNLLLENCSGGGGRFDAGMLFYGPQIWCSDDTDAIQRLLIQEGTELVFPLSSMGAHVSDCPNHTVGRNTPFETRGHVALAGTFGYELDVTRIPENDRNMIPSQIKMYHKFNDLVREGDYYRLASYSENNHLDSWMTVKKDKSEALLTAVFVLRRPNVKSSKLYLQGLDPLRKYRLLTEDGNSFIKWPGEENRLFSGEVLMNAGLLLEEPWGDFKSVLIHIVEDK